METGAVGDTKTSVSEVFRGMKKPWHNCIIFEGDYFEADKLVIDK